jgi:hypothetical protein
VASEQATATQPRVVTATQTLRLHPLTMDGSLPAPVAANSDTGDPQPPRERHEQRLSASVKRIGPYLTPP